MFESESTFNRPCRCYHEPQGQTTIHTLIMLSDAMHHKGCFSPHMCAMQQHDSNLGFVNA